MNGPVLLVIAVLAVFVIVTLLISDGYVSLPTFGGKSSDIINNDNIEDKIKKMLRTGDYLKNNLNIKFGKNELKVNHLVINKYGIFVINSGIPEGIIEGDEYKKIWSLYKETDTGHIFDHTFENPIKLLNDQNNMFKTYLKTYGINIPVKAYLVFENKNSPLDRPYIINDIDILDEKLHADTGKYIDEETISKIQSLI